MNLDKMRERIDELVEVISKLQKEAEPLKRTYLLKKYGLSDEPFCLMNCPFCNHSSESAHSGYKHIRTCEERMKEYMDEDKKE